MIGANAMILHPRAVIARNQLRKSFAPTVLFGILFSMIFASCAVINFEGPSSPFLGPLISTITFASSIIPTQKYRNVGVFNTNSSLDSPSDTDSIFPSSLRPNINVNNAALLVKPRSDSITSSILLLTSSISSITLPTTLSSNRLSSTTSASSSTITSIPPTTSTSTSFPTSLSHMTLFPSFTSSTSPSPSVVHPTKTPEIAPGLNTNSPSIHPGTTVALGIGIPALAISIAAFIGWWVLHASPPDSERLASWDSVLGGLETGGGVEGNIRRGEGGVGRWWGASDKGGVVSEMRDVARAVGPRTRFTSRMDILFEEVENEETEISAPQVKKERTEIVPGAAANTDADASRLSSPSASNVDSSPPIAPLTLSAPSPSLDRISEKVAEGDRAGDVPVRVLLVEKSDNEKRDTENSIIGPSTQHIEIPPLVLKTEDAASGVAEKESNAENRGAGLLEKV